jgi:hypothetical protein
MHADPVVGGRLSEVLARCRRCRTSARVHGPAVQRHAAAVRPPRAARATTRCAWARGMGCTHAHAHGCIAAVRARDSRASCTHTHSSVFRSCLSLRSARCAARGSSARASQTGPLPSTPSTLTHTHGTAKFSCVTRPCWPPLSLVSRASETIEVDLRASRAAPGRQVIRVSQGNCMLYRMLYMHARRRACMGA